MLGVTKGIGRRAFVAKVEQAIEKERRELEVSMWKNTPDDVFEGVNRIVVEAAESIYGKEVQKDEK
eukprot:6822286-Lingulodinium_polyedra.AAC.1